MPCGCPAPAGQWSDRRTTIVTTARYTRPITSAATVMICSLLPGGWNGRSTAAGIVMKRPRAKAVFPACGSIRHVLSAYTRCIALLQGPVSCPQRHALDGCRMERPGAVAGTAWAGSPAGAPMHRYEVPTMAGSPRSWRTTTWQATSLPPRISTSSGRWRSHRPASNSGQRG
jgi:hypothetical protein